MEALKSTSDWNWEEACSPSLWYEYIYKRPGKQKEHLSNKKKNLSFIANIKVQKIAALI